MGKKIKSQSSIVERYSFLPTESRGKTIKAN